jgi:hypothetical protein
LVTKLHKLNYQHLVGKQANYPPVNILLTD